MGYFIYKNGKFLIATNKKGQKKRPTNQNSKRVIQKIYGRLNKLIDENPEMKLTALQKAFVKLVEKETLKLSKLETDIAHHIAISVILKVIVDRMNNPVIGEDEDAAEFVEAIITTDSEEKKETIKQFFNSLQDNSILPKDKIKEANIIAKLFNAASKNLLPGHSSSNRSVSDFKDPHLVKDKDTGNYIHTPSSIKIGEAFDKFKGGSPYLPKIRENTNDDLEYQSSSIHKTSEKSWITFHSEDSSEISEKNNSNKSGKKLNSPSASSSHEDDTEEDYEESIGSEEIESIDKPETTNKTFTKKPKNFSLKYFKDKSESKELVENSSSSPEEQKPRRPSNRYSSSDDESN